MDVFFFMSWSVFQLFQASELYLIKILVIYFISTRIDFSMLLRIILECLQLNTMLCITKKNRKTMKKFRNLKWTYYIFNLIKHFCFRPSLRRNKENSLVMKIGLKIFFHFEKKLDFFSSSRTNPYSSRNIFQLRNNII